MKKMTDKTTINIQTKRLILRDYELPDSDAYYALKSDAKTMYYLQDIQLFSKEEAMKDFKNVLADIKSENRKFYFFHIERKDTHEQIGSAGYTVTDNTPGGKLVHAGYFMYPRYWNNGYMTEAFQSILEFAFLKNNVYRVTTGCLAENIGSEMVMKKCGLIKEAEHKNFQWHDGEMKTRLEYRLLKEEWLCANK